MEDFRHAPGPPVATRTLRARWIVPVDQPPLRDGWIKIAGGRIAALGAGTPPSPAVDLGDVLILPGLVNAHTHLEFSSRSAPLGRPGQGLPDWIRAVLAWRRETPADASAIARGLAESAAAGTTLAADIVQPGHRAAYHARPPLSVVACLELLGLSDERRPQLESLAAEHLADRALAPGVSPGLSPHAPYSTHPGLVEAAVRLAGAAPVAMHLAESREEIELLDTGGGPFRGLLEELGVWRPELFGRRRTLDYLQILAAARRALVIHGNYLADDEIAWLAGHAERMSLVYCPRTHAYFEHAPYPLSRLLTAGVSLAIGTDGRGSNPDLSLLEELRTIHRLHRKIRPARILELGTLGGARALGLDRDHGSLTPGKLANLCVFGASVSAANGDPLEALLAGQGGPRATLCGGAIVAGNLGEP